jgi:hypothetical protein
MATFSAERKCLYGATNLKSLRVLNDYPEKQRGRPRTLHTDENSIVKGLIREEL